MLKQLGWKIIIEKSLPSRRYNKKLEIVTARKPKPKLNMTTKYKSRKKNFSNILTLPNSYMSSQTICLHRKDQTFVF